MVCSRRHRSRPVQWRGRRLLELHEDTSLIVVPEVHEVIAQPYAPGTGDGGPGAWHPVLRERWGLLPVPVTDGSEQCGSASKCFLVTIRHPWRIRITIHLL